MNILSWYLDEGGEARVFLLLGFDDLQGEGLVTAEGAHRLLDLLLLGSAELQPTRAGTEQVKCERRGGEMLGKCLPLFFLTTTMGGA